MCLSLQAVWDVQLGTYCSNSDENKIVSFEHISELDAVFVAMASGHLFLIHIGDEVEVEEVWQWMLVLQHWTVKFSAVWPATGRLVIN